jgi:senataxin
VSSLQGGNIIDITDVTFSPPELSPPDQWTVLSRTHNHTQLYAIKYVVDRPVQNQDTRICLVQGPPGTGKTKTVLGMISALLYAKNLNDLSQDSQKRSSHSSTNATTATTSDETNGAKNRLLICAPSNAAVDELLSRLQDDGIVNARGKIIKPKMVRLGKPLDGSPPKIDQLSLDNQIDAVLVHDSIWTDFNQHVQDFNKLQQQLREMDNATNSIRFDREVVKKRLRDQLQKMRTKKIRAEVYLNQRRVVIRKEILESADIVASTLSSSGQSLLVDHIIEQKITFDTVIVDEAGQTTEPATLIPLRYGCRRLVLVGDARQLPAYVCSKAAERAGLGVSLFERLERSGHEIVLLTVRLLPLPSCCCLSSLSPFSLPLPGPVSNASRN